MYQQIPKLSKMFPGPFPSSVQSEGICNHYSIRFWLVLTKTFSAYSGSLSLTLNETLDLNLHDFMHPHAHLIRQVTRMTKSTGVPNKTGSW